MHPGMEYIDFGQHQSIGKWWNYLLIEGIKRSALFWTLLLLVFFIVSHVLRRNVVTLLNTANIGFKREHKFVYYPF